jgi:hypothetical protein
MVFPDEFPALPLSLSLSSFSPIPSNSWYSYSKIQPPVRKGPGDRATPWLNPGGGMRKCNLHLLHFFAFSVFARSCIFLHFLQHDATSARKNASKSVGSCIFKVFLCRRRRRRRLFLMQLWGFIREFLWKFHFFLHFLHILHFFCIFLHCIF